VKLESLSKAWNDLRNGVLGRGVTKPPNVSQLLYDAIGQAYEEWRQFAADNAALLVAYGQNEIVNVVDLPALVWLDRYRDLAGWARAEGVDVGEEIPEVPTEAARRIVDQASKSAKTVAKSAADLAKSAGQALELGVLFVGLGLGIGASIVFLRNRRS